MNKQITLFLLFSCVISTAALAQEFYRRENKYVDTAAFMIWASPNYSIQSPLGNGYLSSTFKFNNNIGFDLTLKTQSNWTIDAVFNYMFGSKIKQSPKEILGDMVIENIYPPPIFNVGGTNTGALTYEGRYLYLGASIGKLVPLDCWKNSGLLFKVGMGYFEHKIFFTDPKSLFPQILQKTHYRLGYDQHASGIALTQFFGYLFMQQKRVLSFYVGIEAVEIFSKPDRGYIFVGKYAGPTNLLPRKFSGLLGIKIGWILPFYEKRRLTTWYTF